MAIEELFECIACCSCGCCCSKKELCERCEISTLKGNGLSESLAPRIRGLSKVWSGNGGFQFSDLYNKLQELLKEENKGNI